MPVLVGDAGDDDEDDFGFEQYDVAEVDRLDAATVLSTRWRGKMPSELEEKYAPEGVRLSDDFAPFSRQFPGLAPHAGESLSAEALREVLEDQPPVRIALIPARRGADVLPVAGWNSFDDYADYGPYAGLAGHGVGPCSLSALSENFSKSAPASPGEACRPGGGLGPRAATVAGLGRRAGRRAVKPVTSIVWPACIFVLGKGV